MEIEIGIGKSGRRAYGFDDIAIVPSRRTRDPDDVDISWELDAYRFELPLIASAMDGVVSPRTAIEIGRLGGLAVLNLEGLQTRYDRPEEPLEQIRAEVAELTLAATAKVTGKVLDRDDHRRLIEEAIRDLDFSVLERERV